MFIHGGRVLYWRQRSKTMVECKYFAKRGYVCASINYRLPLKLQKLPLKELVTELHTRWTCSFKIFGKQTETYKINLIIFFVGGSSAGGITA